MLKEIKERMFLVIVLFLGLIIIIPFTVFAADESIPTLGPTGVAQLLRNIQIFIFALVIPLATIMLIWIGILFLTSQGNPEKINQARKYLFYIVIGFFVALVGSGLSIILVDILSK